MFDFSIFVTWLLGAIAVVGLIEWAKGFFESVKSKNRKSIALSLALPAVCFFVAFGKGGADAVWNAFGMWSLAQLCYALIVQSVQNAFKNRAAGVLAGFVNSLEGTTSSAPTTATTATGIKDVNARDN